LTTLAGQGVVIFGVPRSHPDTPHSVGLLWTRRRDLYMTTRNTHKRQTTMHRWGSNPQFQQSSGCSPTP